MRRETVLMLRSIFIGELHTLHCTKKNDAMRRSGLTGSQRGLGVLGLTSRLGQNRHGTFDLIPDSPKGRPVRAAGDR